MFGGDFSVRVTDKPVPESISPSIARTLQGKATQLFRMGYDTPVIEIWPVKEVALKAKPASPSQGLRMVPETGLLGAVRIVGDRRDYRDDEMYGGTYTMRLGLQPQDGNHLGTSDFPYFGVLIPAKLDRELDGISTYKQLVKASSKETATDHPVLFSLRPVDAEGEELPTITKPATDHRAIRIRIPGRAEGVTGQLSLVFDLVIEGVAQH